MTSLSCNDRILMPLFSWLLLLKNSPIFNATKDLIIIIEYLFSYVTICSKISVRRQKQIGNTLQSRYLVTNTQKIIRSYYLYVVMSGYVVFISRKFVNKGIKISSNFAVNLKLSNPVSKAMWLYLTLNICSFDNYKLTHICSFWTGGK